MKKYKIIFGEKDIQITDRKGNEIVYWIIDEWIEDPNVVFSIANAIELASKGRLESYMKEHRYKIKGRLN